MNVASAILVGENSVRLILVLDAILLVSSANVAPVAVKRIFGARFAMPIDGGMLLHDGRPLLGSSKTWRGFLAGCLLPALLSPLIGLPVAVGILAGVGR